MTPAGSDDRRSELMATWRETRKGIPRLAPLSGSLSRRCASSSFDSAASFFLRVPLHLLFLFLSSLPLLQASPSPYALRTVFLPTKRRRRREAIIFLRPSLRWSLVENGSTRYAARGSNVKPRKTLPLRRFDRASFLLDANHPRKP